MEKQPPRHATKERKLVANSLLSQCGGLKCNERVRRSRAHPDTYKALQSTIESNETQSPASEKKDKTVNPCDHQSKIRSYMCEPTASSHDRH